MASGVTSDENPAFVFAGFMPTKAGARQKWLKQWCAVPAPIVMFESPHRLAAASKDLLQVFGPERKLTIARELTKSLEQVHTLRMAEAVDCLPHDAHQRPGAYVSIAHAAAHQGDRKRV